MDRLAEAVTARGMSVMARIDHAGAAARVGLELRPTEVLIFGNPRAGTPLMQSAQTLGIDLPLRALVWQDEQGKVFLGYYDPQWLAARHGLADGPAVTAISAAMAAVAETGWSPVSAKSWDGFARRLPAMLGRYRELGLNADGSALTVSAVQAPGPDNR